MTPELPLRRDTTQGRLRFVLSGAIDAAAPDGRHRLASAVGIAPEDLLLLRQVHGTTVVLGSGPWPAEPPEADGIVVVRPGAAAAVRGADCMPLLLGDPVVGVGAAVHVGRAGLLGGIVAVAVQALVDAGARELLAVPGPTVCGRCYEVPEPMSRDAGASLAAAASTTSWGTPSIDIPAGVRVQLGEAALHHGLPLIVDDSWEECTMESPHLYSHRRDATAARHAGLVQVLP